MKELRGMNIEVVQGISPMGLLTCSYWIKESYAIMLFFKVEIYVFNESCIWDFPGGLVVKTPCFH